MKLIIGSMRGNLFYSLRFESIQVPDAVRVERLYVAYNPMSLLSKKVDITVVSIDGLDVDVDGVTTILKNLSLGKDTTSAAESSPWSISIRELLVTNSGVLSTFMEKPVKASLDIRAKLLPDRFVIDSLRLTTEKSLVTVNGDVPLSDSIDLGLQYELSLVTEEFGIAELKGTIHSQGQISGKLACPFVASVTELDARYSEYDVVGTIQLDWQLPHFADLSLDARLRAMMPSLIGDVGARDTMQLLLSTSGNDFVLDIVSGYGLVKYRGLLAGDLEEPELESRIQALLQYDGFRSSVSGQIHFKNNIFSLRSFRIKGDSIDAYAGFAINILKQRIDEAHIDIACRDLSIIDHFIDTEQAVSGKMNLAAKAAGSLNNPRVEMELSFSDVTVYGENVTSAYFDLSMGDRVLMLDSGSVVSRRGQFEGTGWYNLTSQDINIHVFSDEITFAPPEVFGNDTIYIGGRVNFNLMVSGNLQNLIGAGEIALTDVVYDTLALGSYRLDISLEDTTLGLSLVNDQASLTFEGTAFLNGVFPFEATLQLAHFVVDDYLAPNHGYLCGVISARGDMSRPDNLVASIALDTMLLGIEQRFIKNVGTVKAHLEDNVVTLESCVLKVAGQDLFASGAIPLDLEKDTIDLSIRASRVQLSDITELLPDTVNVSGIMDIDLTVRGQLRAPELDGRIRLENVKYVRQDLVIDSLNSLARFNNSSVSIEDLRGRANRGRFSAHGFVDVTDGHIDTLSLKITADKIDYRNKDLGKYVFSTGLQVSARNDTFKIEGEVVIDTAKYDVPFRLQDIVGMLTKANRPAPEQPKILNQIYCDVGISAPNDVRIDNQVADLEVSVDLQLKGYLARLNVYGSIISVGEGKIAYLGKKFNISHAAVHFDNPYKIDPVIDLSASTTVSAEDGDYEIYMQLEGTVNEWQLALSSSPPLPEQDIVSLLLIGQRRPGSVSDAISGGTLAGRAESYAVDLVRYGVERGAEQYLGLDKVRISGQPTDTTEMELSLEKSIGERFTLLYSMGLESWEILQVGAKYDVTNKVSIFTLYDQVNLNTSVDVDYHFKIR